jgi:hypothetical protein
VGDGFFPQLEGAAIEPGQVRGHSRTRHDCPQLAGPSAELVGQVLPKLEDALKVGERRRLRVHPLGGRGCVPSGNCGQR